MLKTQIDRAKVFVTARFENACSVPCETVRADGLGVENRCEITSSAAPEKIAKVVRNAEAGCYVIQKIRKPTEVKASTRSTVRRSIRRRSRSRMLWG